MAQSEFDKTFGTPIHDFPAPDPAPAPAPHEPAGQWGTFGKNGSWQSCLAIAQGVLQKQGYTLYVSTSAGDYTLIGGNGTVVMLVNAVPQSDGQTWMTIFACATDAHTAELARNTVRAAIVATVPIDDGTALNPAEG